MATFTNYQTPSQKIAEFSLGPYRARIITVTPSADYDTPGEAITAAQLGWKVVIGAMELSGGFANAAGTLTVGSVVRANAAKTALTFQAYDTGAVVGTSFGEVTDNDDLSLYSGLFLVLGH